MSDLPSASWLATLTRFDPPKTIGPPPDWDRAVQVLARHGLGPIAGYNLAYKMPLAETPDFVKDVLLGYMQGTSGDNVFKFVTLKAAVGELEVPIVLLGGAAFTETLYPHVAFRPVPDLELLVRAADLQQVVAAFAEERFYEVELTEPDPDEPAVVLHNDRIFVRLFTKVAEDDRGVEALFERAQRAIGLGRSLKRLAADDALVVHARALARRGFIVPLVQIVDLREMVLGQSPLAYGSGPGTPIDPAAALERARALGAEKALWAAMEILVHYHPETEEKARALQPPLGLPTRTLLRTAVVEPAFDFNRDSQLKAMARLQKLLLG